MDSLRNEVSIELADETRTMRATFGAIRTIEYRLGKSMMAVIKQAADGDLSITDAAVIVWQGLTGYGDTRLTLDQVGEAIISAGLANVSVPIIEFVSVSLNGVSVGKPAGQEPQ